LPDHQRVHDHDRRRHNHHGRQQHDGHDPQPRVRPGHPCRDRGPTVTWVNDDGTTHAVTADGGAFDSGHLADGATFHFAFDQVGDFPYHCSIHTTMHGIISAKGRA
jgi:plastocyanin